MSRQLRVDGHSIVEDVDGETRLVATVERAEDIHTFAAAPELLWACRAMTNCLIALAPYSPDVAEGVMAIVDAGRLAIAKAEGRHE